MEICHAFLLLLVHSWSQGVSAIQQKQFERLLHGFLKESWKNKKCKGTVDNLVAE
jgi:hypothetical protein